MRIEVKLNDVVWEMEADSTIEAAIDVLETEWDSLKVERNANVVMVVREIKEGPVE